MSLRLARIATMLVPLVFVVGCAGSAKKVKVAEKDYDWSDYKGTYATGDAPKDDAKKTEAKKADKPATDKPATDKPVADKAASDAKDSRRASKAKIQGESVSSVSADVVAGASKTALKSKIVSTNTVVGAEYEQIQVVLNKGVAVQIIRPAAKPDGSGPKVRSPKARNDGLNETDSGYYDEQADVLVLVQSTKKATSKKALKALLKK